jgi:hypothetical protein
VRSPKAALHLLAIGVVEHPRAAQSSFTCARRAALRLFAATFVVRRRL